MWKNQDLALFLNEVDIENLVKKIAFEIEQDYQGQDIVWVCPLKGSVFFLADLMRRISLPQRVECVYLKKFPREHGFIILKDVETSLRHQNVLIIEEIIDAGKTLYWLKERIKWMEPASLKIVTLLDKPARRQVPLKPDYVGRVIDDRFVVGYGMDFQEWGRNLKQIYYLKN